MAKSSDKVTPLMQQYNRIKGKYPDAILLFRVGDFYETFNEDAILSSKILGIVLTKRSNGKASEMDLAGFPFHSIDTYLPKLVKAGYRVAICEQLEDPKLTKTIVQRGVTEMITPGVTDNDKLLNHKNNNFLCSVFNSDSKSGVAFLDISTGEFLVSESNEATIEKLIQSLKPSEIIFSKFQQKHFKQIYSGSFYTYAIDDWIYKYDFANESLLRKFDVSSLKGFGIGDMNEGVIAAGAILQYLSDTEHHQQKHINKISRIDNSDFVWMDRFTVRNLEIASSNVADGLTLLDIMDETISPMGARLMKRWVLLPLIDQQKINERLYTVEFLIKQPEMRHHLSLHIKKTGDIERIISKIANGKISPREIVQLKKSLGAIADIKVLLGSIDHTVLNAQAGLLNDCRLIQEEIEKVIIDDAPVSVQKGNFIKNGISSELDKLRLIANRGKDYLIQIQKEEIINTGINSLKINFNNVFGYYLEVTHAHKDKVPANWIRKQTLVNAERYITPELKEYEEKITGAESEIQSIEEKLFSNLISKVSDFIEPMQLNARIIAHIDCLLSFAHTALKNNYHKPVINDGYAIEIKNGRHPVIEKQLLAGQQYIGNDIYLDDITQQLIVVTGPNMAGKSALLRQTALIVIMAQCGSFVPADDAQIGIIDKIFTRVGASDNLSSGESTFMVEMTETASILNNLSNRSLVLLDEIGRGTSTFDGISIAWSIAEFIHENKTAKAKTLFATHYHELNELENKLPRVKNFNVSIKEVGNKILFMRKLVRGGSQHSFGIHVAKMAGIPTQVVNRANEILKFLEQKSLDITPSSKLQEMIKQDFQLNIFEMNDPQLKQLKLTLDQIDINSISPVEALLKLQELKNIINS